MEQDLEYDNYYYYASYYYKKLNQIKMFINLKKRLNLWEI